METIPFRGQSACLRGVDEDVQIEILLKQAFSLPPEWNGLHMEIYTIVTSLFSLILEQKQWISRPNSVLIAHITTSNTSPEDAPVSQLRSLAMVTACGPGECGDCPGSHAKTRHIEWEKLIQRRPIISKMNERSPACLQQ